MNREGQPALIEPLTEREEDILALLVEGKTNREIAEELVLSMNTVKWYNRQIYGKLGVESREELAERARELGLVAAETPPRPRHNLPLQLSSFIGREWELAEVRRLLSASRLVTLTGAGGSGKSRLALQAATGLLDDFADGVWLVELASLSDATFVPHAVAAAFDVRESEGRPILSLLQSYLLQRKLLLLLDNCEHLVEAAAQLAEALLSHCPQLQILATSREALAIAGEAAWLVPTLSLPEPGALISHPDLLRGDAVGLFVERATAALPTFSLTEENTVAVEQLCRRLDGMPLAIELAAARVKLLRVEQIAARLGDRFRVLVGGSRTALPRHQTLRALIDWSYELLAPAEQRLLRYLSVFAGGFTLDAVEAIYTGDDEGDVLELLAQLVNKSLVVAKRETGEETRYRLLETIRQYAWAKLAEAGETSPAQDRHLDFFLRLAESAEPRLQSEEQLVWLDRLETEHDNLRAALAWSLENHLEPGLRLATALAPFWIIHSHLREGRRWLDPALERRHGATLPVRARLLCNAGRLLTEQWEKDPTALLQESLDIYRQLEDERGMAASLCWLGWCDYRFRNDRVAAVPLWEEGLALAGQVDDRLVMSWLYHGLAWEAMERGDFDQTIELSTKGLALARGSGDRREKLRMLFILGRIAHQKRDYSRAATFFHETLALVRELKDVADEAATLSWLGTVARYQQNYEEAATFYHESLALRRELGSSDGIAIVLHNLGMLALGQGDQRQARALFWESMVFAQEAKHINYRLWNIWGLAHLAVAEGQMQRAIQLFAAAMPLIEFLGGSLNPIDFKDHERHVALARARLGEKAFAAAWAEGEAMSLEEAVALAMGVNDEQ